MISEDLEINGLKEAKVKVFVNEFVDTQFTDAEWAAPNALSDRLKNQVLTPNTSDANIIETEGL